MKKEKFGTVLVKEYVFQKVEKSDVAINIPHEPIFYQEWNCEVMTGIFPDYMFDNTGRKIISNLRVIEISDNTITRTGINISLDSLSDIVTEFDFKGKSHIDVLQDKVVRYLKEFYNSDRVTKENFMTKLEEFNNKINKTIL